MTPKARSQTDDTNTTKPVVPAGRPSAKARKRGAARLSDAVVPIVASDERRIAKPEPHADHPLPKRDKDAAHRESLTEQRLDHIPGEDGRELQPYRDDVEPRGPMNKASVHQPEPKVPHPMGKTRSGVAQRRGR